MFSLATSKIGVISKSVGLIFYVCCFTGWGTSAIPSTPSWWCSSGASSSPDPRWPETSGISWWASASNFSPTSEPPPPWDNEAGRGWRAAKQREKKWGSTGYGWWEVLELKTSGRWSLHRHLGIKWNHKTRGHRWSYWTSWSPQPSKCCISWIHLAFLKTWRAWIYLTMYNTQTNSTSTGWRRTTCPSSVHFQSVRSLFVSELPLQSFKLQSTQTCSISFVCLPGCLQNKAMHWMMLCCNNSQLVNSLVGPGFPLCICNLWK